MRVVVWNIANDERAFPALATLEPDVALLNEASPPPALNGIWREATEGRDSKRRPWSAAVLSPHLVVEITDARPATPRRAVDVPPRHEPRTASGENILCCVCGAIERWCRWRSATSLSPVASR